jgi:hypothetical protein
MVKAFASEGDTLLMYGWSHHGAATMYVEPKPVDFELVLGQNGPVSTSNTRQWPRACLLFRRVVGDTLDAKGR